METKKRDINLDVLKILACCSVVVLHVFGTQNNSNINMALYYGAVYAIPIFFMVNRIFINKEGKYNL